MTKAEYNKKWRKDNPDKAKEYSRKWYLAHPGKAKEHGRKWRLAHPDKVKDFARRYRNENYGKYRRAIKTWQVNNKDRIKLNRLAQTPEKRSRYAAKLSYERE